MAINTGENAFISKLWLVLFVTWTWSISVSANEVLEIVYDNAYPPYMFGDANNARGLYPTLIKKVFEQNNISVRNSGLPWKRALQMGRQGAVAVGGVYPNKSRRADFVFSEPIFSEQLVIYVRKGQRFPFNNAMDLKGKDVGMVRGYTYGDVFDHLIGRGQIRGYRTKHNKANFDLLINNRVDCIITELQSARAVIAANNLNDRVERLTVPFYQSSGYLVVAKDSHLAEIIPLFNSLLEQSKGNGSLQTWATGYLTTAEETYSTGSTTPSISGL